MAWPQNYDPFHNTVVSTAVASIPILVLLGLLALGRLKSWTAAGIGLCTAMVVAIWGFGMPIPAAAGAALYGAGFGLFPVGWIIVNVLFLHELTVKSGCFSVIRQQLAEFAPDPRIQAILVAFCFGAFVEGVAGFGAPVAITAALMVQLGFSPLQASGLSLIANTAPVAFGSLGIPIVTLHQVTGLDTLKLSSMAGRELPLFSAIIPAWIVLAMGGFRALRDVWLTAATAGVVFGIVQFIVSNFHGPWLVDSAAAVASMTGVIFVQKWARSGKRVENRHLVFPHQQHEIPKQPMSRAKAWLPWILLTAVILVWGAQPSKAFLDGISSPQFPVPALNRAVQRMPPVVSAPKEEVVEFRLNWLSATGTGVLLAGLVTGAALRITPRQMLRTWGQTAYSLRGSFLTIAGMMALGNVTKYSGADATLGLALSKTGVFYPLFGTLLGWVGVALTGSDTASNVLFGSLQRITAEQLGLSPYLMTSANSTGGVMGKMIDAQSIVIAGVATRSPGIEPKILRFVFFHSVILVVLMGLWITLLAYWPPIHWLVVR
jgi:lactate permease